jgi:signal transduction histidine kinase
MLRFILTIFLISIFNILFSKTIDSVYNKNYSAQKLISALNNPYQNEVKNVSELVDKELLGLGSDSYLKAKLLLASSVYYHNKKQASFALKQLKQAEQQLKVLKFNQKTEVQLLIAEQYVLLGDKSLANKYLSAINLKTRGVNNSLVVLNSFLKQTNLYAGLNFTDEKNHSLKNVAELENDFAVNIEEQDRADILCEIIANSIKLERYNNLDKYYKLLLQYGKSDSKEFIYAQALYYDYKMQYFKAEQNFKQLIKVFFTNNKSELGFSALVNLANLYSKKLIRDSADKYFRLAKSNLPKYEASKALEFFYSNFYNQHLLRYKNAGNQISNLNQSLNLKDSLYRNELNASLKEAEYKYSILASKQQIKILKQQQNLSVLESLKFKQRNWLIILSLGLLSLLAFTLSYIYYQKRKRSLAIFKAKALKIKHEHQLEMNKLLTNSQEEERSRIAEKLHDEIGSMLAVVRFNLSSSPKNDTVVLPNGQLKTASKVLADVADTIREMSHELMPVALHKLGLKQAIDQLVWDINSANKINIETVIMGLEKNENQFAHDFQINIYRIIQELFQNIIKHSKAKHVLFQLLVKTEEINIMVEDDGVGINSELQQRDGKGMALIKARLNHYNGKITIESSMQKGTLIIIDVPQEGIKV